MIQLSQFPESDPRHVVARWLNAWERHNWAAFIRGTLPRLTTFSARDRFGGAVIRATSIEGAQSIGGEAIPEDYTGQIEICDVRITCEVASKQKMPRQWEPGRALIRCEWSHGVWRLRPDSIYREIDDDWQQKLPEPQAAE